MIYTLLINFIIESNKIMKTVHYCFKYIKIFFVFIYIINLLTIEFKIFLRR